MSPIDVSVVVPVYCSAATLPALHERLSRAMQSFGRRYELVLVDDGSRDDSWAVLSRLRSEDPEHVTAVGLMRNFGQHNALMAGFRHASGGIVVTLDDDLQNPPEEIPHLIAALESGGHDVVYGTPARRNHQGYRRLGSWVAIRCFQKIFRTNAVPTSYRAIRKPVVASILTYRLNFTVIDGLLAWSTQRVGQVEVEHHGRAQGRSGYSLSRLLLHSMNLVTNFSLLPLQAVTLLGMTTAGAGFLAAFWFVFRYFTANITVPGYASLIVAILVLGGAQLVSLGIFGEYLGRVLLNINQKPQYVEREVLSPERDS